MIKKCLKCGKVINNYNSRHYLYVFCSLKCFNKGKELIKEVIDKMQDGEELDFKQLPLVYDKDIDLELLKIVIEEMGGLK